MAKAQYLCLILMDMVFPVIGLLVYKNCWIILTLNIRLFFLFIQVWINVFLKWQEFQCALIFL